MYPRDKVLKLVTGDFNKYVAQWNDHTFARETVEIGFDSSSKRKRICLPDSGGIQLLKGDCGGWKEGGERNIFLGEFKERKREREREGEKRYDFKENSLGCARINTRIAVN